LDAYKFEFTKNANLSLLTNIIEREGLFLSGVSSPLKLDNLLTDNNVLSTNTYSISDTFLQFNKNNLLESSKNRTFKNDLLFLNFSEEKLLETHTFRRTQLMSDKKNKPHLSTQTTNLLKT